MEKKAEDTSPPIVALVLPKALPDVDDVSMTNVTSYIEQYREDLYWSFLSDTFFIVGGISYVLLSIPGLQYPPVYLSILEFVAPTVYLLNSYIDVKWAQSIRDRSRLKNEMTNTWDNWRLLRDDAAGIQVLTCQDDTTSEPKESRNKTWYTRLRRHTAHRRTLLAAWTFGIAAFFAVLAVIMSYLTIIPWVEFWSKSLDALSIFSYIISALISVSGKRTRPWLNIGQAQSGHLWLEQPETLEDLGDILFLIGSIVDGVLCFTETENSWPGWALISSILWFVDACLYLKADFVMARRMEHGEYSAGGTPLERAEETFV